MENKKTKKVVRKVVGVLLIILGVIFFGAAADAKKDYENIEKQTVNVLRTGKIDHSSEDEMYGDIVIGAVLIGFGIRLLVKKSKAEKMQEMYEMQSNIMQNNMMSNQMQPMYYQQNNMPPMNYPQNNVQQNSNKLNN